MRGGPVGFCPSKPGVIAALHEPSSEPVPLLHFVAEVIRLADMMHVRHPLSLRNVEDHYCERPVRQEGSA